MQTSHQKQYSWEECVEGMRNTNLEFYIQYKYPSKVKEKDFSETKTGNSMPADLPHKKYF